MTFTNSVCDTNIVHNYVAYKKFKTHVIERIATLPHYVHGWMVESTLKQSPKLKRSNYPNFTTN